jgi:hypothetical protein
MASEMLTELNKLPSQAIQILRFYLSQGTDPAYDYEIMDGTGLTERGFSKGIKRLITRQFAAMDVRRKYALTRKGEALMAEFKTHEDSGGYKPIGASDDDGAVGAPPVECRLTLVTPSPLIAGQNSQVFVGLNDGLPTGEAELVLQVSVVNGQPTEQRSAITLQRSAAYASFRVTPGNYQQVRLRVTALQTDAFSGDIQPVGGMYVDINVSDNSRSTTELAAYGTIITVLPG